MIIANSALYTPFWLSTISSPTCARGIIIIVKYLFYVLFCRTDSFNLSLNGQDVLDNDSVLLTDLGIVNGDLIYILQSTGEQGNVLASHNTTGSSRDTSHTNQQLPCTSVEHVSDPAQVHYDINYF